MNESTTIPAAQLTALIEERDALRQRAEEAEALAARRAAWIQDAERECDWHTVEVIALKATVAGLREALDKAKAVGFTAGDASSIEDARNGLSDPWLFDGTTTQIIQGRLEAIAAKIRRNLEGTS